MNKVVERRPPQASHSVVLRVAILLLVLGMVLAALLLLLMLIDVLRGHPGATWHMVTSTFDALKPWLIGVGVVALTARVVIPHLEARHQTALQRAEAAKVRAEAKRIKRETQLLTEIHDHNMEHMPPVFFHKPDEYGNYAQPIGLDGRPTAFLLPGNAGQSASASGVSAQFLRDWMEAQYMVEEEGPEEELLQIEGPEQVDPRTVEAPTLEQDLQTGYLQPGSAARMGYRVVIDEFSGGAHLEPIDDPDDTSMFICAGSTAGKSTLVSSLMARMALRGDTVFVVIDPHKNNPERSITAKVFPALEPWLAYPVAWGKDAKEVKGVVKYLRDLITLRQGADTRAKERHPLYGLKVRVIIDEALALAAMTRKPDHDKCYDDLLYLMQEMATETAKDEIIYIAMAQIATKAQMGEVDIRDVCPKTVILKTPKQSGLALNLPAECANMAHYFPRGRGFYIGESYEPELFIWGYATAETIAKVAELATSPLSKPDAKPEGNRIINLYSVPTLRDEEIGSDDVETGWKPDANRMRNQFPSALQAELEKIPDWEGKLDRLKPVIGEDLADVVYPSVWEVKPGRSDAYQKAREEYKILMAVVRWQLENAS